MCRGLVIRGDVNPEPTENNKFYMSKLFKCFLYISLEILSLSPQ